MEGKKQNTESIKSVKLPQLISFESMNMSAELNIALCMFTKCLMLPRDLYALPSWLMFVSMASAMDAAHRERCFVACNTF